MTLEPGTRLGNYEILAPLGAGGMGEVYRATDTTLGRAVAVKVLLAEVATDPERLARFKREAQLLATLNHPNIAAIHGLDTADGKPFLVLELVEGQDLAQRLKQGPLAVDEAMAIARQVAQALAEAHDRGIVHRDLKPANIKVSPEGKVKVLDFGLAKAMAGDAGRTDSADASRSPTLAAVGTEPGMILGTAAYMSPEQARGKPVDKRTDVWAFGCVVYELLAGRPAFGGATVTDCLAAILTREPDWAALPAGSPLELLRRCLQKDPAQRLRDLGDAFAFEPAPPLARSPTPPGRLRWLGAGAAVLLAGAAGFAARQPVVAVRVPVRAALALPEQATLALSRGSAVAISPDGRRVVYLANREGRSELYHRPLDRFDGTPIRGTHGAANPFFSPDGEWVGFFADGKLKRVALQGGAEPVDVCDVDNSRGQVWGPGGTIYFTPTSGSGVFRVAAAGGKPEPVTTLQQGEYSHRWPEVLPGGKAILFTIWNDTGFEDGRIVAQRLDTGERRTLLQGGSDARYAPPGPGRPGHLVYARAGGLMAVAFDAGALRVTGTPFPILEGVVTNLSGGAHFAFSAAGALVYVPGAMGDAHRSLAWVRPDGTRESTTPVQGLSVYFKLSPDGRRMVRSNPMGPARDLWIHDLERGTATRFTYGPNDNRPVWSADGKRIAYASGLPFEEILWKPADGGSPERITTSTTFRFPEVFSRDGRLLAFTELDPASGPDIWVVPLEGARTPQIFARTPFSETFPDFSPDGRWLAYQSNEPGQFEVFVQPYPPTGPKWQVSAGGGQMPRWSRDGTTLFYRNRNAMMAARLQPSGAAELAIDKPRTLFEGAYELLYDIAPDGRFAMIPLDYEKLAPSFHLVLDWFEDRRFHAGRD